MTGRSDRLAILDVDGTLVPGALGVSLLRALQADRCCDERWGASVFDILSEHRAGRIGLDAMARKAYRAFALAIAGRECGRIESHARRVWAASRHALFPFVPELLAMLRGHGYVPMLISGGPIEVVRCVADDLGIDDAYGAVFARAGGRYTGEIEVIPGAPGQKPLVLEAAVRGRSIRLDQSFALGDSPGDLALFDLVGRSLVFEPGPELEAEARARGLPMATRADVLEKTRALLTTGPAACPASPGPSSTFIDLETP